MIRRALTFAPAYVVPFVLALGLAGAAARVAAATAASKASGAQEELRQLKSRIDAIQKRLADAEGLKSEAADALQASERAISDANRAVAGLSEEARSAAARTAGLKRETVRAEAELKGQRAALANLVYQQYTAGRPETLAILLNGGDPNAIARKLHYLTYIDRARAELISGLRESVARTQALAAEAERKAAELAAVTAEQGRQRKRLEQEKSARAQVLTRISRDIALQRREIGTLRRDEARLTRLIEQLARLIARRPKPRAAPEPKPRSKSGVTNERIPERERDESPFARLRGRLVLPVRGNLRTVSAVHGKVAACSGKGYSSPPGVGRTCARSPGAGWFSPTGCAASGTPHPRPRRQLHESLRI